MIEAVRQQVRGFLGYQSWPYRQAASLADNVAVFYSEGLPTLLKLRALRHADSAGDPAQLPLRALRHPITVRPGSHDIDVVTSNIVRQEYGQLRLSAPPTTLIDAGAYIGDTAAYFLSRYPTLRCIALEPQPDNFRLAKANLAPYGDRVTLLPHALADKAEMMSFGGAQSSGGLTSEGPLRVTTTTIPLLLNELPSGRASILKMDVEGAEADIFSANPSVWLTRVDHLIIETHGPAATRTVLDALSANSWSAQRYRSVFYCQPVMSE
jgi:FkbM family methyltransferase